MDLTTLKAHIKTGEFDPYYIFTGADGGIQSLYIRQMAKVLGADIKILDSITDLGAKKYANVYSKNACICVFFDDKAFIQDERAKAFIEQICASGSVLCVFIYTSIDKRTKFYKAHQDKIIEFEHLKPEVLIKYVQRELHLSDKSALRLIDACECDYSRIMLEVAKLKTYADSLKDDYTSDEDCLKYLFNHGLIYRPPQDAVFDFVDAVLKNKKHLAFELLNESYESGEATLILLVNLFNAARQLLQVQSYAGQNKITDVTGLTPFQVKLASGRKGYTRDEQLIRLMELTRNAEKGVKTGEIEDAVAVYYVLSQYWA